MTDRLRSKTIGYVSSDTCRACHPAQIRSVARIVSPDDDAGGDPETVRADFEGVHVTDVPGTRSRLERRGNQDLG